MQAQDRAAGVADDPGGDVEQPVAQRLGLSHGQRAVQQQRLGPAAKVLGAQDQLQLQRLKKRKLILKDQITRLESELIPDLNA